MIHKKQFLNQLWSILCYWIELIRKNINAFIFFKADSLNILLLTEVSYQDVDKGEYSFTDY
jgi:hypothetical protein